MNGLRGFLSHHLIPDLSLALWAPEGLSSPGVQGPSCPLHSLPGNNSGDGGNGGCVIPFSAAPGASFFQFFLLCCFGNWLQQSLRDFLNIKTRASASVHLWLGKAIKIKRKSSLLGEEADGTITPMRVR